MTASYKRPFQPAAPPSASSSMPLTSTHTHAEPLSNFLFSSSFAPPLSEAFLKVRKAHSHSFFFTLTHRHTPPNTATSEGWPSLYRRAQSLVTHTYTQRLVIYLFYFYKQNSALYCQLTRTHTHTHPLHPLYTHFCTYKQPVYFSLPPLVLISSKTC